MVDGPANPLREFQPKPKPLHRIVIEMDQQGNVNVDGPIAQQVLCYGMLEMAKLAIQQFHAKNQQIVKPADMLQMPRS